MRAKWSKGSSKKQEDIQSQFRVLQNDPKDSKSELQGTSNSITPNPLFIQEPQTPITVLRSAAEAKPVNSPHPFRGAGRDADLVPMFSRSLQTSKELRGDPPRPPTLSKKRPKIQRKITSKKTHNFSPKWSQMDPRWVPKSSQNL